MTALDTWILMCTSFVALATFEYATVVAIKFWKRDKIGTIQNFGGGDKLDMMCHKIDRSALIVFTVTFCLSVACYIIVVINKSTHVTI